MKRKFFTFLLCSVVGFTYANKSNLATDPTIFAGNDIIIADFENGGKSPIITDSLWTDSTKTTMITLSSGNVTSIANPKRDTVNSSLITGDFLRPANGWRSLYIRLDQKIDFAKTPYFQFMIHPVLGKSAVKTTLRVWLKNDKDVIPALEILSRWGDVPQDQWTNATNFLGRLKSSDKYNVLEIQINNQDSAAKSVDTEFYIDQIGFKAPADGVALKSTIFNENFNGSGWQGNWSDGKVYKQIGGEKGYVAQFDSIGGFSSGIHFKNYDIAADTTSILWVREWGMGANYANASGGGRLGLTPDYNSTLESGNIDITNFTDLELDFGFGTQQWWQDGRIASARPKIEISADGGAFYEIYESNPDVDFPLAIVDTLGQTTYQDQLFKWVSYQFTDIDGSPLPDYVKKVNFRMSFGAGCNSWVDDMWFAGTPTNINGVFTPKSEAFNVYPNPTSKYITTPNAQKVSITDLNGRLVKEVFNTEKVDVSTLAKGAYIVKVNVDGSTKVGKLIKQ
ncbi:MAG: T9SS type A sorting domain-containing protein [Paludibacter sp.]|nr:T9SS type A sorting domain-containing protein [Paludibacter sp.]